MALSAIGGARIDTSNWTGFKEKGIMFTTKETPNMTPPNRTELHTHIYCTTEKNEKERERNP